MGSWVAQEELPGRCSHAVCPGETTGFAASSLLADDLQSPRASRHFVCLTQHRGCGCLLLFLLQAQVVTQLGTCFGLNLGHNYFLVPASC